MRYRKSRGVAKQPRAWARVPYQNTFVVAGSDLVAPTMGPNDSGTQGIVILVDPEQLGALGQQQDYVITPVAVKYTCLPSVIYTVAPTAPAFGVIWSVVVRGNNAELLQSLSNEETLDVVMSTYDVLDIFLWKFAWASAGVQPVVTQVDHMAKERTLVMRKLEQNQQIAILNGMWNDGPGTPGGTGTGQAEVAISGTISVLWQRTVRGG